MVYNGYNFGIETLMDFIDEQTTTFARDKYPPFNVIRHSADEATIEYALAGYKKEHIDIKIVPTKHGVKALTIKGDPDRDRWDGSEEAIYEHRGLSFRQFKHSVPLAEYWEVTEASLTDGILLIKLKQELPEEKKPKTIDIA